MARNKKETKKAAFKDYNFTGSNQNDIKGRVYLEPATSEKGTRYGLGITINGITIKGCKLWVPKDVNKDCSIMWPEYNKKDGGYESFILILEEKDRADIKEIANKIAELIEE